MSLSKKNDFKLNNEISSFDLLDRAGKMQKGFELLKETLKFYNNNGCQCRYPRFRQIVGIDCILIDKTFQSFETECFIDLSRLEFEKQKVSNTDEDEAEIWSCKKCGSTFEYGFSEFSIAISRQYLRLIDLKLEDLGQNETAQIPLFVGLLGYDYPSQNEIKIVNYNIFKNYVLEE